MSRHEFEFMHQDKLHMMAIGWDVPLQSFFATVYDPALSDTDTEIVFTCGANALEPIKYLNELVVELGPWCSYVKGSLLNTLVADRDSAPQPTALQQNILEFLAGVSDDD